MRFVLIHGGFHGAWCWTRLVQELERLGHRALAIDLPGHGQRRAEASTLENRTDAITGVLQSGDVLVGHSGGGFDITLAANRAPDRVRHLIYLAAGLPIEGRPLVEATGGASETGKIERLNETISSTSLRQTQDGRLEWTDKESAAALFYHDCSRETVDWAFARFSPAPPDILVHPVTLTAYWAAELPRSYVLCLQDRALPFATAMRFAGRLGVVPHFMDTSHSPFLSQPAALAQILIASVNTRPVARLQPA
jgi:pimeloyl-ACP methyl ester carboxylesterase